MAVPIDSSKVTMKTGVAHFIQVVFFRLLPINTNTSKLPIGLALSHDPYNFGMKLRYRMHCLKRGLSMFNYKKDVKTELSLHADRSKSKKLKGM